MRSDRKQRRDWIACIVLPALAIGPALLMMAIVWAGVVPDVQHWPIWISAPVILGLGAWSIGAFAAAWPLADRIDGWLDR